MKEVENQIIQFKKDEKNLLPLAREKEAIGDLEGALSLYLEIEKSKKFSFSIYRSIANIYTRFQMYNESVKYWFKFLNFVTEKHYAEAYNGLGGNYYLLDEKDLSAYYFNLQICDEEDDEYPFDDYLYELFNTVTEKNQSIRIVNIQGDEDKKLIALAKRTFEKNSSLAYELISKIDENSSEYEEAALTLAAFYMVDGEYQKAIEKYETISQKGYHYKFALNNIFGAYYCLKEFDKANDVLQKMRKLDLYEFDQLVKFFHLFHADEALCYSYAKELKSLFNTPALYFYLGVAAYNVKKYEKAFDYFIGYYKITGYYFVKYDAETSYAKMNGKTGYPDRLSYAFGLPEKIVDKLEKNAAKYMTQSERQLKRQANDIFEFANASFCTNHPELHIVTCQVLSYLGGKKSEQYLKELLIDPLIDDNLKTIIISLLVEMGNDKTTGMVYGNVYSKIPFEKIEFSDDVNDLFLSAYALAFGRLAPFDEEELYKIQLSAYELYYALLANGNLRKVSDVIALSAFIAINADMEIKLTNNELIEYMGSTVKDVNKIIKLVSSK